MTNNIKKDNVVRYDKFPKWGKKPDNANHERILATRSLIPDEIHNILDLWGGDGVITNDFVSAE